MTIQFPRESKEYRAARNELLAAELDLRQRTEEVAALRRKLPLGGLVPEDYEFEQFDPENDRVAAVRLSQLFAPAYDSLIVYSYMFGPAMEAPCPMCTSILDALDGTAPHVRQRAGFAVVAKSPVERLREFANGRGWRHLRLLSSANNTFNRDYHAETEEGDQNPLLHVFVRRDGGIYHSYTTEALWAPAPAGQDPRHVDSVWPLWNLFDLIPEGRGENWFPQLRYEE
ncbi:MAG TPA: DUF899 family protein [Thermoanaerobaculia bacterium]|nr:DUF899 family protein [Thermoanaerobaculia bacterium]